MKNKEKIVKIILAVIILSVIVIHKACAQRYMPNQKFVEYRAGWVDGKSGNFYNELAFSKYLKKGNRWHVGVNYLQKWYDYDYQYIPLAQFAVEAGYLHSLWKDPSRIFSISVGAGALAGYESINWNQKVLLDGATLQHQDAFIYGGVLGLELEAYITDWLVLLLEMRERMLVGSTVKSLRTQYGMGIKILIN